MARERDTAAPTVIERFVKSLVVSAKAVVLYPPASNVPIETAGKTAELLQEALQSRSELRLMIGSDSILHDGALVYPGDEAYRSFASELYDRGLAEVRFHAGMSPKDLVAFLSLLSYAPEEARASGGFERRLWERGVSTISVSARAEHSAEVSVRPDESISSEEFEEAIERLAEESDPVERQEIVSALAKVAADHVPELTGHLDDPRWYVVRNVVSLLGAVGSAEVLPQIEKALRHREPRVRREAIRALSRLADPRAQRALTRALGDEDAQNVQLAARYLGAARFAEAVPALILVALGEGSGDRSAGPRNEAIEALGMIGAPEALPALEALASRGRVLRGPKTRALRTTAECAIARITGEDNATDRE